MASPSPQTNARNTLAALLREARGSGWARAKGEIKPDGTVTVDVAMIELGDDDFLSGSLRMGK